MCLSFHVLLFQGLTYSYESKRLSAFTSEASYITFIGYRLIAILDRFTHSELSNMLRFKHLFLILLSYRLFGAAAVHEDLDLGPLQCHVRGECVGGRLLGLVLTRNRPLCLERCKQAATCSHFTFHDATSYCRLYQTCPEIGADLCKTCVTGIEHVHFTL